MVLSLRDSLLAYKDKRIISIFLLGFSSGLPFYLILSTLTVWLKESHISNTTIGFFAAVTLPYSLKFLWGPFVDRLSIPFLTSKLGIRRSWAIVSQISVMFGLFQLSRTNPSESLYLTAIWALLVSFSSAIQDIITEAYRIEVIDIHQQGFAASASSLGYRFGMLASGAGALYIAEFSSWSLAFMTMAFFQSIGILTILFSPSPQTHVASAYPPLKLTPKNFLKKTLLFKGVKQAFLHPLQDLVYKNNWQLVIIFIICYKIGDTALNAMSMPFLVELGFNKREIADVAKLFGISSMILGGFIGGIFLNRFGILVSLILASFFQILSSLMFTIQANVGCNTEILKITIGFESFTSGFGATAFIAYLSSMCQTPNTATHYALLSSFGSFTRILLTSVAGSLADIFSWETFFLLTACFCLPGLFLLIHTARNFPAHTLKKSL